MERTLLRKSDVIKAFDGVQRRVALALGVSAQAVNAWGRYLPELAARQVIELKPELGVKATRAKPKRRRRVKANGDVKAN